MMHYFRLVRYKNLLMIALSIVLIKYCLIASQVERLGTDVLDFTLFLSSTLLLVAAGYAFNDLMDIDTDTINKPDRLIISKHIDKSKAKICILSCILLGCLLGMLASLRIDKPFNIVLLWVPLLLVLLYSWVLKAYAVIGNIVIALFAFWMFPLVFSFEIIPTTGATIWEAILNAFDGIFAMVLVVYYGFFSFGLTLVREIVKDIEDIDGDYNAHMKTLPILIGKIRARNVAVLLSCFLLVFLVFAALAVYGEQWYYLLGYLAVAVLIPFGVFLIRLWSARTKKEFSSLSRFLKVIMLFGIFSMVFFSFL